MQNLSTVARWVADADEEFCGGESCGGEFCAESVAAETKTAPASNMLSGVPARSRIMNAPSHRPSRTTAQGTPTGYLFTTNFSQFLPRMLPSVAPARSVCIVLMALVFASPAIAEQGKLRQRLTPEVMAVVYPSAERLGVEEGSPPAIAVYKGDQIVAYVFSTLDIIAATGYSTIPFDVIAGVDLGGRITGAKVVFHQESMIVHDAVRQRQLDTFLAREAGRPLRGGTNALP